MKKSLLIFLVVFVAFMQFTSDLTAQIQRQQARSKTTEFQKKIQVNYRLVDVIVTDRNGNYVRNLTSDDFELFENGKPIKIESLDEYALRGEQADASFSELPAGELEYQLAQPSRNVVLFFDLFYSSPTGIRRTIAAAEEFIATRLLPGDNIMVVSYDGSIQTLQPFTNNKYEVIETMGNLGLSVKSLSVKAGSISSDILKSPGQESGEDAPPKDELADDMETADVESRFSAIERQYSQYNASNYIYSMGVLARALKPYPGRKTLVMFSEGIDFNIINPTLAANSTWSTVAISGNQGVEGLMPEAVGTLSFEYDQMLEAVNDAQVSLYTINVKGLSSDSSAAEAFSGTNPFTMEGSVTENNSISRQSKQNFLVSMADETGGKAYFNQNNFLKLLGQIDEDISNYYILGYRTTVDAEERQQFRKISVKLKKPGLRVKHRRGFYTPKAFNRMNRDDKWIQLNEGFVSGRRINELEAFFSVQEMPLSGDTANLNIAIQTLGADLDKEVDTEYELWVFNQINRKDVFSSAHITFEIKEKDIEAVRKKGLNILQSISLTPGDNKINGVLRNNNTGQRAYFKSAVRMSTLQPEDLLISKPVFFDPELPGRTEDEIRINEKQVKRDMANLKQGADLMVLPSSKKILPIVLPEILQGKQMRFFFTISNLMLEEGQIPKLSFDFLYSKVTTDGIDSAAMPIQVLEPDFNGYPDKERFAFSGVLNVGDLAPGEYAFWVYTMDRNHDRMARAIGRFYVVADLK
jgi:VWFA-related protein